MKGNYAYLFVRYYINYKYCKYLSGERRHEEMQRIMSEHKTLLKSYLDDLKVVKSELLAVFRWNSHAFEKLKIPFEILADIYSKPNISLEKTELFNRVIQSSQSGEYLLNTNDFEMDVAGRNAMHYACIIGDLKLVKELDEKNAKSTMEHDSFGYLPIELALKHNNLEVSRYLKEKHGEMRIGAKLNILAIAVKNNNLPLVELFLEECNSTHLYYACLYNRPSIIRLLIEHGVHPEYSKDGFFANQNLLHLCAIDGDRVECLRLLLSSGLVNPEDKDKDGWNPLDHAMYRFQRDSIQLLKPYYSSMLLKDRLQDIKPLELKTTFKPKCFPQKNPWIRTFVESLHQEMCKSKTTNAMCIFAFKKPLQELLHLSDTDYFSLMDKTTNTLVEISPIENFSNFYYFCLEKRNIYHFVARYNHEIVDILLSPSIVETGAYQMIFERQGFVIEMIYHFIYINDSLRNQPSIEIPYPLVIGHRGTGGNHELIESGLQTGMIAENTIKSFSEMHLTYGSCCIEFDVQMTLDKIPVVYHDWLVPETGFDSVGLNSLRLGDLKKLKTKQRIIHDEKYERYWESVSKEEIPTLQEVFEQVDEQVGFNIEIKFPHEEESNNFNLNDELPSINQYCDIILDCIAKHCQPNRKIILSSFHPEITIALKFKQCKYPVFYLTECGGTYTWDLRLQSIQQALKFAVQCSLDGIVCDSKIFYWSPIVMQKIVNSTPNVWTYGKYNKDEEHIKFQYMSGVKGLITDTFGVALRIVKSLIE